MIRPIPDFSSSEKTSEPLPKKPTPSIPKHLHTKESNESISKNLSRAPKSTSLKSLIKEPATTPQPINEQAQQSSPFNEEDLIRCWDAYAETLETNAHLKNTMINCKPILLENFKFEVKVRNPAQKEELIGKCLDLLKFLRARLKNDQIQISIHIDEKIEKKTAYTSVEKFEFLNNINPLLSKFIDEFDLMID